MVGIEVWATKGTKNETGTEEDKIMRVGKAVQPEDLMVDDLT
jgi:hypothetical protein